MAIEPWCSAGPGAARDIPRSNPGVWVGVSAWLAEAIALKLAVEGLGRERP